MQLAEIVQFFDEFAPPILSEDWDNVGLLLGDRNQDVKVAMTCLTLSPDVAEEAVNRSVNLIVSHHPILFRAVKRITADRSEGKMLLQLIQNGIAVYSPHTRYDSAGGGINQQLAELFELSDISVIRPLDPTNPNIGSGRYGTLPSPTTLSEFSGVVQERLKLNYAQVSGPDQLSIKTIGIACGSAAEFMSDAQRLGCDALLTGEARFHACLEARTRGMGLIQAGHYGTERPAMENLARILGQQFSNLEVFSSDIERDPVRLASPH